MRLPMSTVTSFFEDLARGSQSPSSSISRLDLQDHLAAWLALFNEFKRFFGFVQGKYLGNPNLDGPAVPS